MYNYDIAISSKNILFLIQKAIPILDECGIPFWLGRGVLRNFYINNEIGEENSDVDFHVWDRDKKILTKAFAPIFEKEGYKKDDPSYKLAFRKPDKNPEYYLEFMYLFCDKENPNIIYHERVGDNKRYCPKICFSAQIRKFIEIKRNKIRVPAFTEQYLRGAYGENWIKNDKSDKETKSSPEMFKEFNRFQLSCKCE